MNTIKKLGFGLGLALVGVVTFLPTADASSNGIGGFGGHPDDPSTAGCFSENWGSVKSSCTSMPGWEISMPANSPGSWWTPNLHVAGNGFNNTITCGAVGVATDQSYIYNAPQQTASNAQMFSFSVYVPQNGYLFTACYMGAGTEWYSVNY
jgi:hypothetical protein